MEGEGMVAVVRGLREEGLAVTLLHGNRQYTLLPNSSSAPRPSMNIVNASTQQCVPKMTVDTSTEPSAPHASQCDRVVQAVDGRYTSMYKTMHCNVRPTSPPVQLTEFPPQRPDPCPAGHGNFVVGGGGSGATAVPIVANSAAPNFRGGMSWPDRGSVCSPRPSQKMDAFVKSLRRYPCLSPDRSSEVMERLVNYSQAKGLTRYSRNLSSPSRVTEPSCYNAAESKSTNTRASCPYEPDICICPKMQEESPIRDRKRDEPEVRPVRCYNVRCTRDMSSRMRENVRSCTSYPYSHPVCPSTIIETADCHTMPCDCQTSSNSVNIEVQAAVRMLSKEVATTPKEQITWKTVAVPESPTPTAAEENVEGECYFVENLDITTSIKSIQTSSCPSDTTLKPRKSAQTVFSTIDFHSTQSKTVVSRKTKSQEQIKLTKEELKMSLLELINEVSDSGSKNIIRDELIKKLFVTADSKDKDDQRPYEDNREKFKNDNDQNFVSNPPPVYDYVGDYYELVGKLKHCYGDANQVVRTEISPLRITENRQLDLVLKEWINNLNLKSSDIYMDRTEILNYVEDCIKELLKNWTAQDFDLKTEIVNILQEIPIEINKHYNAKSYQSKLVDVLLKRMRNVIVNPQAGRARRKTFASRQRNILTEKDIRDFLRAHLMDFYNEYDAVVCDDIFGDLENEMVDLTMDSIDCIRCGHIDDFMDEMESMLQEIGQMTENDANYASNIILQDLVEMINSCHYNQTYMILNVSNNTGQCMNATDNTDFSIGSINEEDLNANLDRYTSELCLQINQWLDTLNIPRIKDSGFREVVVNDLAGDIVDRHKYVDLNHTNKDTEQDQLEALKYQIFKWINKLVGDENQETIGHAENLLQMINSVPVPMLVIPKNRNMNDSGSCCEMDPNALRDGQTSPPPYSRSDQEMQGQVINQSRQCCEQDMCQNSSIDYSNTAQEMQDYPRFMPVSNRTGHVSYSQDYQPNPYALQGQGSPRFREEPDNLSAHSHGPTSPDNPWGSNTYSSVFEPPVVDISQICPGQTCGSMDPNQQPMYDPNGGAPQNHSGAPPPLSTSIKKLNEDYDEYLKEWVKRIPIAAKTPAERQAADTARLMVYNEIWKGVTKMKLDPNIFSNNQYYSQNFFEEDIERLLHNLPKSQELDAAKSSLKAQLLQKTLAMNNLIKSTNAPASFKQQLIDNIDNNLPERTPIDNEEDKQNEELEKQNLADLYILYTRYKDEDSIRATVYKKNFLKKLDEFLDKIKNKHNLADMNKNVYANEIIDSFDKIPTPYLSAIKDEADDILLAMEVENWLTDIPQKPNTAGPLDKRRTRDAIVKKIQEIAERDNCCDNAFRVPLKADLPKYLEKLPVQEGTNVEYMVEELANRIKNLSTSTRRVSFQAPQNYDEFSRNMPAASSFHDMSEPGSSFLVVGENIVKDPGPRRTPWMNDQSSVPEDEIEWVSMDETRMLSIPQGRQAQQAYFPKPDQVLSARSYRSDGSVVRQNRSGRPDSMHLHSQHYNPNESAQMPATRSYQGEESFMRNMTMPREDVEWFSMEDTQMKSNFRGGSPEGHQSMRPPQRYIPNESGPMPTSRSYSEGTHEVPGQFFTNAQPYFDHNCHGPYCPNVQGQLPSNLLGGEVFTRSPCCPNPACLNQNAPGSGSFPETVARSQGPTGSYRQHSPNGRGNVTSPFPRGTYGQGSPNRYNQSLGPATNQMPLGTNAAFPNQGLQGSNVQSAPVSYNQVAGQGFGPHTRYGRGSLGQMPYHRPNGAQMGQAGQEPWSNGPGYQQTGQGYLNAHHNTSAEVQASLHSATLNQTAQSPGPTSAASQVPDQATRPYHLQKMTSGGILGTSQVPGPSTRTASARTCCPPNASAFGAQQAGAEAIQPGENQTNFNDQGTDPGTPPEEPKHEEKPLKTLSDIHEQEVLNAESVITATSTIDISTTKIKYCEMKSKSQQELTKKMKEQKVVKRADLGSGDLQQQVTQLLEIDHDKIQAKLLDEKMKKLAEKLKTPGGEEKLRTRIEKYLSTPEESLDDDDENLVFKKQLSHEIIRKLKKIYLTPEETNINVYRMEPSKYSSRSKMEYFKKAVLNWTNGLNIKKKDFLGRNVKKNDVFKYVSDKLEDLVLDRPKSDIEYKGALKSNITEIVNDLPLVLNKRNKEFFLNTVTDNLVNEIFESEKKLPTAYIQPTVKEIKEFIKDEITFFFQKSHVAISTKRKEYLENELIELVLDFKNITDIDDDAANEVTGLLKKVGRLPEYKAKYFTNLLLKDYKDFYFRERYFQLKGDVCNGRPDVYSAPQSDMDQVDTKLDIYTQNLENEITKWLIKLDIPTYDKSFIKGDCKDLSSFIIDRHKYLLLHPSARGTEDEENEHLKFLIFKWMNKLVGEEYTSVLAIRELMDNINVIPNPSLQNTSEVHASPQTNVTNNNTNKSYIDMFIEQVYDWFCEVNKDLHISEDTSQYKLFIKEFAEEIENGLEEDEVIDKVVAKWSKEVFNDKLSKHDIEQLKNIINNIPNKNKHGKHLKQEKVLIRAYEDIVDEWLDTVPMAHKRQEVFIDNKNEIVHALAVKIFKTQGKIKHLAAEVVQKKLQEELSHWLKKLPLHGKIDNQYDRDMYAADLVKNIKMHNLKDSLDNRTKPTNNKLMADQIENVMLEGITKMPLYRDKCPKEKEDQDITVKELARKLTIGKDDASGDKDIIKRIKLLDPKLDDKHAKNTACQLKLYLENLEQYNDLREQNERENKFLVNTIEVWLKGLPMYVSDVSQFRKQITDFISSMKQLISSGVDKAVMKKKILIFTRSLPISHAKKYDLRYLNEQVSKLMQNLMIFPASDVTDVPRSPTPKTNVLVRHAIKEWTNTLPLKTVYCPMNLRDCIDDLSSVLTSLILNPENNSTQQNDMSLHREIVRFLRRLPLIYELSTENHISRMAGKLVKTLNAMCLTQNENCPKNNVTVYGVSLQNNSDDLSIESIKEHDINQNLTTYTKQLVQQISEWFDQLNLTISSQEGFKEVVIKDLAGDIVDRHKYLELNPNNRGTDEDELEHLKYQIFKWINKLVGEENFETIGHAEELMHRINQIPVPMLVRPQDKSPGDSNSGSQHQSYPKDSTDSPESINQSINSAGRTSDVQRPGVSFTNSPTGKQTTSNRMSSSNGEGKSASAPCCSQDPPPEPPPAEEGTKAALFEKYVAIFREACDGLAIDESSPYAEVAKTAIYNGIIKAFFNLKSNPEIENDYGYFEFILEEKLDNFLDVLPQTEELQKQRYSWKVDILKYSLDLLEELHKLSDRPCFRQLVKNKFNRQFAIKYELEHCFLLQQGYLAALADAYILETNYKEKDPLKANIYKNRLMKKVDELANHLSKEHNAGFRFFNIAQLSRLALKVLEQVPIPSDDILQDEVEEIHIADVVEKWYKELPTRPLRNESDGVLRKRMMGLLAKKLHDIQKRLSDDDPSKEEKMKHEMSVFLEKRAELQPDEDLNINFMVEQLHNRLKNRWLHIHDPPEYDEFAKDKPLSSSLAHVDNAEILASLMDDAKTAKAQESAGQRTLEDQGYFIQPGQPMQNISLDCKSHSGGPCGGSTLPASPQSAAMRRMDANHSRQAPNRTRTSHGGSRQGHVSQQGMPMSNIKPPSPPRSTHEGHTTRHSPTRPNSSLSSGRHGQASIMRPKSMGPTSIRNARSQRAHNINQSLRQVGLPGKMGQDQNMPSQMQGSGAPQGHLFVPGQQGRSQGASCSTAGSTCTRGPTPSQGVGTTADATSGSATGPASSGAETPERGYRVKCKCMETYRKKLREYYQWPCDRHRHR